MAMEFNMTDSSRPTNMADCNNIQLPHQNAISERKDILNTNNTTRGVDTGSDSKCSEKCISSATKSEFEVDNGISSQKIDAKNNTESVTAPVQYPMAFEVKLTDSTNLSHILSKPAKTNLQEAFLQFRKMKQDEMKQEKQRNEVRMRSSITPGQKEKLREKIITQAKKYFGVPYGKKYWSPNTPEHKSPIFLDCCGLVRQVIRDLHKDLGFRLGPWNQSYMFDTLPITVTKEEMKPGDLVFMTGVYVNGRNKKQIHNMLHVEIWLGDGDKTIGSRWNNGKVQVFDSYKFSPKSFHSEEYIFKSIDTWLMGVCQSHCDKHPWRLRKHLPSSKSIFNVEEPVLDEKADFNSDDDTNIEEDDKEKKDKSSGIVENIQSSNNVHDDKFADKIKCVQDNIYPYVAKATDALERDKDPQSHRKIQDIKEDNCYGNDKSVQCATNDNGEDTNKNIQCPKDDNCADTNKSVQCIKEGNHKDTNQSIQYMMTDACPDVYKNISTSNTAEKNDHQTMKPNSEQARKETNLEHQITFKNNSSLAVIEQNLLGCNRFFFTKNDISSNLKNKRRFKEKAKFSRNNNKTGNSQALKRFFRGKVKTLEQKSKFLEANTVELIGGGQLKVKPALLKNLKIVGLCGLTQKDKVPRSMSVKHVISGEQRCDEQNLAHVTANLLSSQDSTTFKFLETPEKWGDNFQQGFANISIHGDIITNLPELSSLSTMVTNPYLSGAKCWSYHNKYESGVGARSSLYKESHSECVQLNPDIQVLSSGSYIGSRYEKGKKSHSLFNTKMTDNNGLTFQKSFSWPPNVRKRYYGNIVCSPSVTCQNIMVSGPLESVTLEEILSKDSVSEVVNDCQYFKRISESVPHHGGLNAGGVPLTSVDSCEISGNENAQEKDVKASFEDEMKLCVNTTGGRHTDPNSNNELNIPENKLDIFGAAQTSVRDIGSKDITSNDGLNIPENKHNIFGAAHNDEDIQAQFADISNTSFTSVTGLMNCLTWTNTRSPNCGISIHGSSVASKEIFVDVLDEVEIPLMSFESEGAVLNEHLLCMSLDVYADKPNRAASGPILHGFQCLACDACGNINNNSSKDWHSDFADSVSNVKCELISESELHGTSGHHITDCKQKAHGSTEIRLDRTKESDGIVLNPSTRSKDKFKHNESNLTASTVNEETMMHPTGNSEEIFQYISEPTRQQRSTQYIWSHQSKRLVDLSPTPEGVCRDTEDSDTRVARYVLNQWPKGRGISSSGGPSAFQSYCKSTSSLSPIDSNQALSFSASLAGCWCTQKNNAEQEKKSSELYEAKTSDVTYDQTSTQSFQQRDSELSPKDSKMIPLCSLNNLNEFNAESAGHAQSPCGLLEEREYIDRDDTSNDGQDEDDINDSESDDVGDVLNYYDLEKQAATEMMQDLVGLCGSEDSDFCGNLKEVSNLSARSSLLDFRASLYPGDDELCQKIQQASGDNLEERGGMEREECRGDSVLRQKTSEDGGGDTKRDNRGDGDSDRKGGKRHIIPPCCKTSSPESPTFFVGGANGISLVEGPLLAMGWKRTHDRFDENYKLKWVENKSRINYLAFREGEQLVNHIPNCGLLTNKLGLLCSLQDYERMTLLTKGRLPRMKMADFVPETYKLDDKGDREKFLHEYQDGEIWICKPTSMNQGKGIFLLRSREKVNQLLYERDSKLHPKSAYRIPMMRIVQRYISHPLLIDGRKFDIRSYMFIASTIPFLVLYHKGYARLSCHKYHQEDTNMTTHLTNQFVQKKDPSYKDIKEDTAWTMEKLNSYINKYMAEEKGLEADWVFGALTKQMQKITLHCFNSVKHKLQCKMGYFDLYGMDFMVDSDMKVWLIEINANPALHTNCQALREAIPSVIEDALYLAIECFEKSCKGEPLMPLNSLGGFSVLYCGSSPNSVNHRQIRSVSPFKDVAYWNRPTVTNKKNERKTVTSHTLPSINIDLNIGSGHGNTSSIIQKPQKQKYLPSQPAQQQQHLQRQPQKRQTRNSLTENMLVEGESKYFTKNTVCGIEKSHRLHRGS